MASPRNNADVNLNRKKYAVTSFEARRYLLMEAIHHRFFDHLRIPISINAAAEKMHLPPNRVRGFLAVLLDMGIVTEWHGLFCNTQEANDYFVSGKAQYLGVFLKSFLSHVRPASMETKSF